MKKYAVGVLSIMVLVSGFVGYRVISSDTNKVTAKAEKPKASIEETVKNKDSIVEKNIVLQGAKEQKAASVKDTSTSAMAYGTYVGRIDNNSVEVIVNKKATALFLSDNLKKNFNLNNFKKGNKVQIFYYKNTKGQLVLNRIYKVPTETSASGYYVGQIDNNSIEVEINNKPTALYFSDSVKKSFNTKNFKKGTRVDVTYYKNDKGQLILTGIKNASTSIMAYGIYVGRIDNNSVEITISNKPTALFLSDNVKKNFKLDSFKKGNKVQIFYYRNTKGQLVLNRIYKA
jgi:hypothetical protein